VRIALVAPPFLTVPPRGYGGTELVVALLADGLTHRGHEVTLFASGGSHTAAALESPIAEAPGAAALADEFTALAHVIDVYRDPRTFDVIHDHTVHGTALAVTTSRPGVVHTLHGAWTDSARRYYSRIDDRIALVAISETQKSTNLDVRYAGVVPNGIDLAAHPLRTDKDEHVVFVGRCTPDKGPERAIEVARRADRPLVMVLKRAEPSERTHWEEVVEPALTGSETILEDVPHDELLSLVAGAQAMIFPITWAEPFGLVIAEAMACGTPVITRPLGAAQEIVADGETGFLCDTIDDMCEAMKRVSDLDPETCRKRIAERFSADAMVDGYEAIYRRVAAP
jgi:glycosyltransferase involved in cell wall biosynthesis